MPALFAESMFRVLNLARVDGGLWQNKQCSTVSIGSQIVSYSCSKRRMKTILRRWKKTKRLLRKEQPNAERRGLQNTVLSVLESLENSFISLSCFWILVLLCHLGKSWNKRSWWPRKPRWRARKKVRDHFIILEIHPIVPWPPTGRHLLNTSVWTLK